MSATVEEKNFFPLRNSAQPDHFLLHMEELPSYPVLFLLLQWSFSTSLYKITLFCFFVQPENTGHFVAVHFLVPHSLNSCLHPFRVPIFPSSLL
jgi:hypothetical protein